jgi:hypothetical protein
MTDLFTAIINGLKDPILILVFCVLVGLYYLLLKKEKNIAELHKCIDTNMSECNETIVKLVTLVEVLVYGRNRNGNP